MEPASRMQLRFIAALRQDCLEGMGARRTRVVFEEHGTDIDNFEEINFSTASKLIDSLKYFRNLAESYNEV